MRLRLETEAKLRIQERIAAGELELARSYLLDYENAAHPFEERRTAIRAWKSRSVVDVAETPSLLEHAKSLVVLGARSKDALHVASAVEARCDDFMTTDGAILEKLGRQSRIMVVDPTAFVRSTDS